MLCQSWYARSSRSGEVWKPFARNTRSISQGRLGYILAGRHRDLREPTRSCRGTAPADEGVMASSAWPCARQAKFLSVTTPPLHDSKVPAEFDAGHRCLRRLRTCIHVARGLADPKRRARGHAPRSSSRRVNELSAAVGMMRPCDRNRLFCAHFSAPQSLESSLGAEHDRWNANPRSSARPRQSSGAVFAT